MEADLLIVGGGVAGLTLAVEAARRGLRVALATRGVFEGATGAASGIVTLQLPPPALDWALEASAYYSRLGVARPLPGVWAAPAECVESLAPHLEARGAALARLDPARASEMAGVRLDPPEGYVLAYTTDSLVDVGALRGALEGLASRLGVEFLECIAARARREAVECAGGRVIEAGEVVVAAGAWTPRIAGLEPREVAGGVVYNCEASSAALPGLKAILYVDAPEDSAYAAPESPGTAIIGDGPNTPLPDPDKAAPQPDTPYRVLETLSHATPHALEAYPRASWAAPCLVTGDGLPAVGRRSRGGPILYTGLDGVGLMAAPTLSRLLAAHLARGDPLPRGLDPARPAEPWNGRGPPPEPYRQC